MRLSYQAEIRPTPRQRQALLAHAGTARWAYNWGLSQHRAAYEKWVSEGKPKKWKGWPNYFTLHPALVKLKKTAAEDGGVPWMYEVSKCAPQEALRNLDVAFKNFLQGRASYPKFKSRNKGVGGFRVCGDFKVDLRTIPLPVIGRVAFQPGERGYLPEGRYSQISITEKAGRWFVAVVGPEVTVAEPNGKSEVGLDLGVAHLATLSDGTVFENPKALFKGERKIKRLQREVSRKQKGSANRLKAVKKLQKAHDRVYNVRRDALHKVTTTIAKNQGKVVIEDLKVRNMTRSASGPGRSAKAGLNRVLADASFGEFRRLLEYKAGLYGCDIVAVAPHYTSQRCSACGHVAAGNRTSQAKFQCLSCGHEANADLNAAVNILVAASSSETENACGEDIRLDQSRLVGQTSLKQEPGISLPLAASEAVLGATVESVRGTPTVTEESLKTMYLDRLPIWIN